MLGNAEISNDNLFDEIVLNSGHKKYDEWKAIKISCEENGLNFPTNVKNQNISVPNLRKVMKYIFFFDLPVTFNSFERLFSKMKSTWSQE